MTTTGRELRYATLDLVHHVWSAERHTALSEHETMNMNIEKKMQRKRMWRKAERRLIDDQCSWMGLKPTVAATDLQRTMQTHTKYKRDKYMHIIFFDNYQCRHTKNIRETNICI